MVLPPIRRAQQKGGDEGKRIKYCTLDMEATWQLYQALEGNLYETECIGDGGGHGVQAHSNLVQGRRSFNMWSSLRQLRGPLAAC